MEEENRKPKALSKDESNPGKAEKIYLKKDLILTAIIAFLIGAIISAGGFAIERAINKGNRRDFRQDRIQTNIGQGDFRGQSQEMQGDMNRNNLNKQPGKNDQMKQEIGNDFGYAINNGRTTKIKVINLGV